ncbi:MAG TPA: Cna B-type domain-containing protein [Candidatus Mediterraneibacter intestinigallinarum]|nr:Cna B-type domain-containing protein [Candidatus Mediterraneibacter intestinigallinarum]
MINKREINSRNHWSACFTGLDEYQSGTKIIYTIREVNVAGYNSVITGDTSSFAGWIVLLSLSGIGLAVTSFNIVRKKHKR